jgi:fructokinase
MEATAMSSDVVGLGEVLWDLLPGGKQLGGAPFNFTFHCHRLGHASVMVSGIGADALGNEIRARAHDLGLSDEFLQVDAEHATGTVQVTVDGHGQPTFVITPDVAWDHLAWEGRLGLLLRGARAVCFGTLAQRHPAARQTIQHAVREGRQALVVYDVNLRQHFYNKEVIEASLAASRWVKLNDDELPVLCQMLGITGASDGDRLEALRRQYRLDVGILTRGAHGCLVRSATETIDLPGIAVNVVDTVGAGDAFAAGLVTQVLEGQPLATAAGFANQLAACVAASAGATPILDRATIDRFGR